VKELALIFRGQLRDRRLEAREDRIETRDQAVDSIVAGKAAAPAQNGRIKIRLRPTATAS